jgi:cell division protein FtsB
MTSVYRGQHDPVGIMWRRLLTAVLFLSAVAAGWGAWGAFQKERESGAMRVNAEQQLADLEARRTQVTATIHDLSTDRGKEAVLREQYGMARPGEELVIVVEPPQAPVQATTSPWYVRLTHWW